MQKEKNNNTIQFFVIQCYRLDCRVADVSTLWFDSRVDQIYTRCHRLTTDAPLHRVPCLALITPLRWAPPTCYTYKVLKKASNFFYLFFFPDLTLVIPPFFIKKVI